MGAARAVSAAHSLKRLARVLVEGRQAWAIGREPPGGRSRERGLRRARAALAGNGAGNQSDCSAYSWLRLPQAAWAASHPIA